MPMGHPAGLALIALSVTLKNFLKEEINARRYPHW